MSRGPRPKSEDDNSDGKEDRHEGCIHNSKDVKIVEKCGIEIQKSYIPTKEHCELKDLCRYREEISKKISDETRRIKSQMSRNCQILPESYDNFQTVKERQYVLDHYGDDHTLSNRMNQLNIMFRERDHVAKMVESRLPDSKDVELS